MDLEFSGRSVYLYCMLEDILSDLDDGLFKCLMCLDLPGCCHDHSKHNASNFSWKPHTNKTIFLHTVTQVNMFFTLSILCICLYHGPLFLVFFAPPINRFNNYMLGMFEYSRLNDGWKVDTFYLTVMLSNPFYRIRG